LKEDEMSWACSTHETNEICIYYFGWNTWREEKTRKTWA